MRENTVGPHNHGYVFLCADFLFTDDHDAVTRPLSPPPGASARVRPAWRTATRPWARANPTCASPPRKPPSTSWLLPTRASSFIVSTISSARQPCAARPSPVQTASGCTTGSTGPLRALCTRHPLWRAYSKAMGCCETCTPLHLHLCVHLRHLCVPVSENKLPRNANTIDCKELRSGTICYLWLPNEWYSKRLSMVNPFLAITSITDMSEHVARRHGSVRAAVRLTSA